NLTLHPNWHYAMPMYEHVVGVVTHLLSALAFYLMLTKTPQPTKLFAKYLMLLQVAITLVDFNYGLLYCPIVLFPVPGGICYGILCTWFGLSGFAGFILASFALSYVSISIILCYHFKYVSIGAMIGNDSFDSSRHTLFRVVMFFFYAIPPVLHIGNVRNVEGGSVYVETNFPSLYYLFANPEYHAFAYDMALFPEYSNLFVLSVLLV
ncbi:hypothetical protein PENTCL1PPCAC_15952, partial [Pristionchus entomophagus]